MKFILKGGPRDGDTDRVSGTTVLFNPCRRSHPVGLYKVTGEADTTGRGVFSWKPRQTAAERAHIRPPSRSADRPGS